MKLTREGNSLFTVQYIKKKDNFVVFESTVTIENDKVIAPPPFINPNH